MIYKIPMFFKFNIVVLNLLLPCALQAQINTGLWSTGCIKGLDKKQLYENNQVSLVEYFHQDAKCQDESFRFQTSGTVTYNYEQSFIDFIYEKIQLTVFKQNVTNDFNARKVCGLDNWAVAQAQNITGLKCALFNTHKEVQVPKAQDRKFGIYQLENNKLYFGKLTQSYDGSSPEKRPRLIDKLTEYIFRN